MSLRVPFDAQGIKAITQTLDKTLGHLGGVNTPEMKAAAGTLAKSIRRTLSVSGGGRLVSSLKTKRQRVVGGRPSAPGQPPHAQTKRLAKSVKHGPVGPARRVGVLAFYAGFQEEGVSKRKIERRPFMMVAYEAVRDQMVDVVVTNLDAHVRELE